jgi:aldose 1-epimerase
LSQSPHAACDPALRPIVLRDDRGLEAWVLPYGATLARLRAPDREGRPGDVVLSLEDLSGYRGDHPSLGSTVGRYANRIGGARFCLDGRTFSLAANDGPHHLHGGPGGFAHRVWSVEEADRSTVRLRRLSPDGEEGYPGGLDVTVVYALADGALRFVVRARTDAPTVVSIAQHAYFDLEGDGGTVLDQDLWLGASRYAPVDDSGLPVGTLAPVDDTPFDFRRPRRIGERIAEVAARRGGYDHPFALDPPRDETSVAARLLAPRSGRVLEVRTTQPSLQLYTANGLDGRLACRGGLRPGRWAAVCLETQAFPDAPNVPAFPSARLDPGAVYHHTTVYSFSID